jgi:hypothetical protein
MMLTAATTQEGQQSVCRSAERTSRSRAKLAKSGFLEARTDGRKMPMIDLRSDTCSRPTPEMRIATDRALAIIAETLRT